MNLLDIKCQYNHNLNQSANAITKLKKEGHMFIFPLNSVK